MILYCSQDQHRPGYLILCIFRKIILNLNMIPYGVYEILVVMQCLFLLPSLLYYPTMATSMSGPSSPHSIKQVISNGGYSGNSKLQEIYNTLTSCSMDEHRAIRTLQLKLVQSGCNVNPNEKWSFDFRKGDTFPPLHELHLDSYQFDEAQSQQVYGVSNQWYYFRRWFADSTGLEALRPPLRVSRWTDHGANLEKWKAAMDWTQLRSLGLEAVSDVFMPLLKGRLPALQSLRLGWLWSSNCQARNVTDFVTQLEPLASLSLSAHTAQINITQILDRHGSTLDALQIRDWEGSNFPRPTLSLQEIEQISRKCLSLSKLGLDINRNGSWPYELLDALAANQNLTSLEIFFELGMELNQDKLDAGYGWHEVNEAPEYRQPLVTEDSSLEIFNRLRSLKQGVELQNLTLYLGDFGRDYGHMLRLNGWGEDLAEAFECSVLDSEGKRKEEGEAWCKRLASHQDMFEEPNGYHDEENEVDVQSSQLAAEMSM